ncbi:MAG: DNA-processing protein DprA [Anaerolineae bacterium]
MNGYPESALWLALLNAPELRRSDAKRVVHSWCVEGGRPLTDLFEADPASEAVALGLSPEQAEALPMIAARAAAQAETLAALREKQIHLMTRADVAYPEALVETLPEERLPYLLFYRGNPAILTQPAPAVLGATQPSAEATDIARDLARTLVEQGHPLVGGYDRGVDRLALDAARGALGQTTLVLPLGLNRAGAMLSALQASLGQGKTLVLSPYMPDVDASEALVAARQAIVVALSAATFLVAPSLKPGEWPAVDQALASGARLAVWANSSDPITEAWISAGVPVFADVLEARRWANEAIGAGADEHLSQEEFEERHDVEPISFDDPDSAIETLGRSGRVPDALARRLREADWTDD